MSKLNFTPMAYSETVDKRNVDEYNKVAQVYGDSEILRHLLPHLTNNDVKVFVEQMWNLPTEINIKNNTRHITIEILFGGSIYQVTSEIKDKSFLLNVYRMAGRGNDAQFLEQVTECEAFDHIKTIVKQITKQSL